MISYGVQVRAERRNGTCVLRVSDPGATALSGQVRRARLQGAEATLDASGIIAELIDTCVRLADTVERTALIRERGRHACAASRAARQEAARARLRLP